MTSDLDLQAIHPIAAVLSNLDPQGSTTYQLLVAESIEEAVNDLVGLLGVQGRVQVVPSPTLAVNQARLIHL